MDFDKADFSASPSTTPSRQTCVACHHPLEGRYWVAGTAMVCEPCGRALEQGLGSDGAFFRVVKAALLGCGAGLLCAIGYGLILTYAQIEAAIVTIFIGWFVGKAVLKGSEGRGGRGYQVLGALLTYGWCMMAYVPSIVQGSQQGADPAPWVIAVLIAPFVALALPFMGEMGILGVLILAFGVWRGWQIPRAVRVVVSGPFELGAAPAGAPVPALEDAAALPGSGTPPGLS